MKYNTLADMISKSSCSRKYFLSLPVDVQIELHKRNDYIHSLQELHRNADNIRQLSGITQHSSELHPLVFS